MLGAHPMNPVLLATDLAAARHFYHELLGMEILNESDTALTFRSGFTLLSISKSTTGTADTDTQASWRVPDIRAEVKELRAQGVDVEEYDTVDLKTEDGIADIGFAWAAWITDPGKNSLSILQVK